MENFETTAIIDKSTYMAIKSRLFGKPRKIILIICALFFAGLALNAFLAQAYGGVIAMLLLVTFVFVMYKIGLIIQVNFNVKTQINRYKEVNGGKDMTMKTIFEEEFMQTYDANKEDAEKATLLYNAIESIYNKHIVYILFTKAKQIIVVNKATLMEQNKNDDFITFIKNKCPQAKWKK